MKTVTDRVGYRDASLPVRERVADLLGRMTLEEKAAQMVCVWQKKATLLLDEQGNFDHAKAQANFGHGHGLGQVGRPSDAGGGKNARDMAELTNAIQRFFVEESRLGIPVIFHEECLHGHAAVDATSFPQPIGLGATFDAALRATNITGAMGTLNAQAKSAARSAFESAKQRFFGHLLTSMKTPTLVRSIERDLENGHAAVVQIVSTGEALMERRLAEIPTEEWNDIQVDITPREYVLDYLLHSFPVQLYEPYTDSEGNLSTRPVLRDGQPVESREAVARRDRQPPVATAGILLCSFLVKTQLSIRFAGLVRGRGTLHPVAP